MMWKLPAILLVQSTTILHGSRLSLGGNLVASLMLKLYGILVVQSAAILHGLRLTLGGSLEMNLSSSLVVSKLSWEASLV